jgi:lysozyme
MMVPDTVIEHLKLREGVVEAVYLDSLDFPTAGVGHLLSPSERDIWLVGEAVPVQQIDQWLEHDAKEAWEAAGIQADYLGEAGLQDALCSVCFQLGTQWRYIHKKTWAYLEDGEWELAAQECEDSKWYRQTPVRVRDFQKALRGLAGDEGA